MGSGIAQVLAHHGKYNVTLADVTEDALVKGKSIMAKSLARITKKQMKDADAGQQEKFVQSIIDSVQTTTDAAAAVKSSDLVIEAIIENVKIKQELFKFLDSKAPESCIFTTNTSSLSVKDVSKSSNRPDRFGGFHAFNPVPQMKLVEIVRTDETSDETFNSLMEVAKKMGKVPVACVDSPGFIVNRLLVPYMLEAIRLVERGEATIQDVDTAMKLGAGCAYRLAFLLLDEANLIICLPQTQWDRLSSAIWSVWTRSRTSPRAGVNRVCRRARSAAMW